MGLHREQSGEIIHADRLLTGLAPHRRAAAGVGWIPDDRGIYAGLTVEENLTLPPAGRSGWTLARVYEAFPILRERRTQPAGTMSGGQQQQLAIGRALVQRPKLLMLDEMSMGLSPTVVSDLFALVRRLADGGMAVVMVEQFVGQALKVADQAVVIEQGTVHAAGKPSELSAEDIGAAYLGKDNETRLPGAPRDARQQLPVSLAGVDVRKLERLAAEQGRTPDELAQELLEKALAE
jgi:branched-chain amino acid transport system ATP-binding protein